MTTRNRRRIREAIATLEQRRAALKGSLERLHEVGRVLSAANEDKLRQALAAIDDVLKALDSKADDEASKEARRRALELAEAYSGSAADAGTGAWIISMLLDLMSDESDEPDDLQVLKVAYNALVQWLSGEVAEVGTVDDDDQDPYASMMMGWEAQREAFARIKSTAIAVHHTDTTSAAWDGGAAEANLSNDDGEEEYRGAYAWQDPDADADTKSAYKFPHHDVAADGTVGAANTQACSAAIAVLNGSRGGADIPDGDRAGVYSHLAAHLKDAGQDPPALQESWSAAHARLHELGGLTRFRTQMHEGKRLVGDMIPLREAAVAADGSVQIKLIQPGWGSTGYYSPQVLEQGASVFPAGTKMFWDHSTLSEDFERPERSLRDLAGELITDAVWDPNGKAGAGLYANAKVFSPYRDVLDEIAPSIGVSIVAYGQAENGTAEGKSGQIITQLVAADSVDYVTYPGAGGQVLSLIEAARQRLNPTQEVVIVEVEKDPKFVAERQARLTAEQRVVERDAKDFVATKLVESKLPEVSRKRLAAALEANPPTKDGKLDETALAARVSEAVDGEIEYLAHLTEAGQIRGMGHTLPGGEGDVTPQLEEAFQRLGQNKEAAKIAATGRSRR